MFGAARPDGAHARRFGRWAVAAFGGVALALVGCGRSSLLEVGDLDGSGSGGGSNSAGGTGIGTGTGTGTGKYEDPCHLPPGKTVLAPWPTDFYAHEIRVAGGWVTLRGFIDIDTPGMEEDRPVIYAMPVCGGELVPIAGNHPHDLMGGYAVDASGVYYATDGVHHRDWNGNDVYVGHFGAPPRALLVDHGELFTFDQDAGSVLHWHGDSTSDVLGSAGPLAKSSNFVANGGRIYWIGSQSKEPGPLFSVSEAGNDYVEGPKLSVPYDLVSIDGGFVASYPVFDMPDYGNIERIALDGTVTVLATNQFVPSGLSVARGLALWYADGVVRSVPVGGGDVVDLEGQSLGTVDPSNIIIDDPLAADDDAFYEYEDGNLIRVRFPE